MDSKTGRISVRPATSDDHAALKSICLKTGDVGQDATDREDDPDLIGLIYAVPYQVLEPEFAFVAEDGEGVCGYVLGTPDTGAFERRINESWFSPIAAEIEDPGNDKAQWRGSDWARHYIHHPPNLVHPELKDYPAHGHIDILPRAQGLGVGRRLLTRLMQRLADADAPAMHLGVNPTNTGALAFYRRLGFERLKGRVEGSDAVFMVRTLKDID